MTMTDHTPPLDCNSNEEYFQRHITLLKSLYYNPLLFLIHVSMDIHSYFPLVNPLKFNFTFFLVVFFIIRSTIYLLFPVMDFPGFIQIIKNYICN